ncbi:MAG: hypothetical protein AAFR52_05070, partial [Pseudomonadota bacterium]
DTIFDFENNIDTLAIDRALVGNRTAQQVVDDFAEIVGGAAVFAFNASDVLEVRGIANVDALVDDIAFL